jgi:hypothetical protein
MSFEVAGFISVTVIGDDLGHRLDERAVAARYLYRDPIVRRMRSDHSSFTWNEVYDTARSLLTLCSSAASARSAAYARVSSCRLLWSEA